MPVIIRAKKTPLLGCKRVDDVLLRETSSLFLSLMDVCHSYFMKLEGRKTNRPASTGCHRWDLQVGTVTATVDGEFHWFVVVLQDPAVVRPSIYFKFPSKSWTSDWTLIVSQQPVDE